MMGKRALSLFAAALLLVSGTAAVYAEETPVSVDNRTRTVSVDVESIQYPGTKAAIVAWAPGYGSGDALKGNLGEINAYTGECEVTEEKRITKTFVLREEAPSGRYTLEIHVPGLTAPMTYSFDYRNVVRAEGVLHTAQTGTAAEVKAALDNGINDVSVEAGVDYLSYANEVRSYIAENVTKERPADEDALRAKLLYENNRINQTKALVAAGENRAEMKRMIEENSALFLLEDYMEEYRALGATKTEKLYNLLSSAVEDCVYPEQVAAVFAETMKEAKAEIKKPANSTRPTGGGSGGGGSKGSSKPTTQLGVTEELLPNGTATEKAPEPPFGDIENHWAANPIKVLTASGVVNGRGDGNFYPDDVIKKEEFLKILVSAFQAKTASASALPFSDVPYGCWYYDSVLTAYELKVTSGVSETEFGAGTDITRQDMAVLLYNMYTATGKSLDSGEAAAFSDAEDISGYAKRAVETLSAAGIISGRGDGCFAPNETATRAEAVKILYEAMYLFNLL